MTVWPAQLLHRSQSEVSGRADSGTPAETEVSALNRSRERRAWRGKTCTDGGGVSRWETENDETDTESC